MYNQYFDFKKQEKIRKFFLSMSEKGEKKKFKQNEIVEVKDKNCIYIVTEGRLKQSIYSINGEEKIIYLLEAGDVFNEINYFCQRDDNFVTSTIENVSISILSGDVVEKMIKKDFEIYSYFMNIIADKYFKLVIQMANVIFNDANGKVADTILNLYLHQGIIINGEKLINFKVTHEEMAKYIGCSRVTVTKIMNKLKSKGIIDIKGKKIIIKNIDKLKQQIKWN